MGMAANKYLHNGGGKGFGELDVAVSAGDVVWCAFPFHDTPNKPGPKARPCLVLEKRDVNGKDYLLIAYGTSQHLDPRDRWPGDIVVGPADGEHFAATGLDGLGKFRLSQLALLPARPDYFPWPPFRVTSVAGRPVEGCRIGRFTPLMLEVVAEAWKQLRKYHAEQADRGMVPAAPLGPLAEPAQLSTGKYGMRPRMR